VKKIVLLCTTAMLPSAVYAQSTGTIETEKSSIVITGNRAKDVGGIQTPNAPKAKAVLTQEIISRSGPGQTVLDTINVVPGVSFQNNDAYGNGGGTLTMRGFDSTRISYTLDGIQLNDSGNYNIFSNFSIDPELIEQVNVNLGSTDVDSPTASAVGGTINQRTRTPSDKMGYLANLSLGDFDYRRAFGMLDLGTFTPWGTRAFVAASLSSYRNPYDNYGKLDRAQFNGKVWQPVGGNGDFVSIAARYNEDRNNFFGSSPLRTDLTRVVSGVTVPRIVGPNSQNRFPTSRGERFYNINYPCTIPAGRPGLTDGTPVSTGPNNTPDPNGDFVACGTEFNRRYNPSNSVNIRGNSRFTLMEGLVLTVDPSFQYTKANGGGTVDAREFGFDINNTGGRANCVTTANSATVNCVGGYFGGKPYFNGVDLNGDGDFRDTVNVLAPSQTRTRRYALVAGIRYEINREHSVRVAYTHDYANHRQTGEVGLLGSNGEPFDVFPVNDPLSATSGILLQKRDRQSFAILNKYAVEYNGRFGNLRVNLGASLPYFTRDLQNNCFTSSAGGFVECSGSDAALDAAIAAGNPYTFNATTGAVTGFAPPGHRVLKYHKLLPTAGLVYNFTPVLSAFASYTKNISVPSTDNLYNSFFFPAGTEEAKPAPETTDSYDAGVRYSSSKIQAQVAVWSTTFNNRLASAFDPELNQTVYRNLGRVKKWGIDGSIAYDPIPQLTVYAFGSLNRSKIQDNIQIGKFGTGVNQVTDCDNLPAGATQNDIIRSCAFTKGRFESGAPKYSYGTSLNAHLSIFDFGVTAKRTGPRYVFDTNVPTFSGTPGGTNVVQIYGATAPAYWLVNLDARVKLSMFKGFENSYFQLNVYNVFDKFFVGGFNGGLNQSFSGSNYGNPNFVQIGAPRTVSGTLSLKF